MSFGVIASAPLRLVPRPIIGTGPSIPSSAVKDEPQPAPWPQPTIACRTCGCCPVSAWKRAASPLTPRSGGAAAAGAAKTSAARATAALRIAAHLPVGDGDAQHADSDHADDAEEA